jgi:hypothetical protein
MLPAPWLIWRSGVHGVLNAKAADPAHRRATLRQSDEAAIGRAQAFPATAVLRAPRIFDLGARRRCHQRRDGQERNRAEQKRYYVRPHETSPTVRLPVTITFAGRIRLTLPLL